MTAVAAGPPSAPPARPPRDAGPGGGFDPPARARRIALTHARTADGLLAAEPGRGLIFAAADRAVAAPVRCGRTALIPGGPLAAAGDVLHLVGCVSGWATALGLSPLWLNVTAGELPALRAAGYAPTRTGSDCVVRHPGRWSGPRYRALRAAAARAGRGGLTVREPAAADDCGTLRAVFDAHLAAKPQRAPATPFVARPPAAVDPPRRVWVAEAGGRSVGYATAHPLGVWEPDGSRRWTLGAFHTRPDAPPGAAATLVRAALDALAADGVTAVSLGPAPAVLTGPAPEGGNPTVVRGVRAWYRHGNGLFDARGLWHFKSRFRPTLEPLYACGRPRVTARQAWDFVQASGVLRVRPGAALRGTLADRRRPASFARPPAHDAAPDA